MTTPVVTGGIYGRIDQVDGGLNAELIFPSNRPVYLSLRGHDEIEACARGMEEFAASLRKVSLTHEALAKVVAADEPPFSAGTVTTKPDATCECGSTRFVWLRIGARAAELAFGPNALAGEWIQCLECARTSRLTEGVAKAWSGPAVKP